MSPTSLGIRFEENPIFLLPFICFLHRTSLPSSIAHFLHVLLIHFLVVIVNIFTLFTSIFTSMPAPHAAHLTSNTLKSKCHVVCCHLWALIIHLFVLSSLLIVFVKADITLDWEVQLMGRLLGISFHEGGLTIYLPSHIFRLKYRYFYMFYVFSSPSRTKCSMILDNKTINTDVNAECLTKFYFGLGLAGFGPVSRFQLGIGLMNKIGYLLFRWGYFALLRD
ncbi:hypothetical protein ACJX0J_037182 [Zea mays]